VEISEKGKKYDFEICKKMHGKFFFLRIHPTLSLGVFYSRRRANGKEEKIRLLEETPCLQSRAF
jgi:hypothetical protein